MTQSGRCWFDSAIERRIERELRKGQGILKVAGIVGVGTGTVQRIKDAMNPFGEDAAA